MKKLFFFDIDGTFLCEKSHEILPSTKKAYKQLLENGHDVYLCTGRNQRDTLKISKQIGADSYISSNGQYIIKQNKEYYTHYMTSSNKMKYLSELENTVWGYMTCNGVYIIKNELGFEKEAFSSSWMKYEYASVENFLKEDVLSIIIVDKNKNNYPMIAKENNMYFWSGNHFQVIPCDINKGIGIKELVKSYPEEVKIYCFGDNDNDIQMFDIADVSVAMGNGTNESKKNADIVTKKASEDGLYHALLELGVIDG